MYISVSVSLSISMSLSLSLSVSLVRSPSPSPSLSLSLHLYMRAHLAQNQHQTHPANAMSKVAMHRLTNAVSMFDWMIVRTQNKHAHGCVMS